MILNSTSNFAVCSSFFNYLLLENYVQHNPVALIRQKSRFLRRQQTRTPIRKLSELQWSYVIETAERMATENPGQHERTLFIMNALYGLYLRISELAASSRCEPQMQHFYMDRDGNWFFKTVGKGNKERDISVSDAMLAALKRYRTYLKVFPLPFPGDSSPLLPKERGNKEAITSTRRIRVIVQACFDSAIKRMQSDGFKDDAELLMTATVHWLRHTSISEDVKHRPKEHVRDDAGHSSSAITDKYIDVETRERHASHKKRTIKPV
jgi:site-specific recombinase XerD